MNHVGFIVYYSSNVKVVFIYISLHKRIRRGILQVLEFVLNMYETEHFYQV